MFTPLVPTNSAHKYRLNEMTIPRFSIITVCFNALDVLPATLASLRNQTFKDYEWVVIDGASSDGSTAWLAEQSPDVLVSERDKGIYDAMNKAVARANGERLFFLNAGDRFADDGVLNDVVAALEATGKPIDCVYGDVVYFGTQGQRRKRFHWLTPGRLVFGDLCHQAAFVRRELFQKIGNFDINLRFNADFDWFMRLFRSHPKLHYMHRDIALFHDAGAHVLAREASEKERNAVRARYVRRPLWLAGHWALRVELKARRLLGQEIG